VQLTPPGSGCSVIFGSGITAAAPGSLDQLLLMVSDIQAARDEIAGHGIAISEIFHDDTGIFHHAGTTGRVPGLAPDRRTYGSYASFTDPDGNGWVPQEITTRLPGH
jgi:hypothetical protein